ncbi:MAG: LamG domain-containing protein [Gammaproteobacteria bacterium]
MAIEQPNNSEELSGATLADVIHAVAVAIADGQFQLDKASMRAAEFMSGHVLLRDMDSGRLLTLEGQETDLPTLVDTRVYFGYSYDADGNRLANRLSMMELGFVPSFYQFVDTVIDMKLTLRLRRQSTETRALKEIATTVQSVGSEVAGRSRRPKPKTVITATPVDARYSSSYNFSAEMTSKVSTKLVPVPPPAILETRIRALMDQERLDRDRMTQGSAEKEARNLSKQPLGGPVLEGDCYEIGDVHLAKALVSKTFTVEAWVSPKALGARARAVGVWMGDENEPKGWLLGVFDGEFGFALASRDRPKATIVKARGSFSLGQWHHLAAVYDGAKMRLYVDGQRRNGSVEQSGEIAYPDEARLLIGGYGDGEGLVAYAGRIDDVRLWNRALTGAEIKDNMDYRLQGVEPGLVGYWRLDLCKNDIVPDAAKERHDARKRHHGRPYVEVFSTVRGFDLNDIEVKAGSSNVSVAESGVLRVRGAACLMMGKRNIPFDSSLYRFEIMARQAQEPTTGGKKIHVGGAGFSNDTTLCNTKGENTTHLQHYCAVNGADLSGEWTTYTGYIQGTAIAGTGDTAENETNPGKFHRDVRSFRLIAFLNWEKGNGVVEIARLTISKSASV